MPENNSRTRVLQHLLVQDFTLYTAEAVACLLLQGSTTLLDPDHAWVVEIRPDDHAHFDRLIGTEPPPLVATLLAAAETCRQQRRTGALMFTQGASLFMPLDVQSVRGARMRIEAAVILGKRPPTEKLEAFGDEQFLQEARRRKLIPREDTP